MGYQTNYSLSVDDGFIGDHMRNIGELSGYKGALWEDEWKWYDHEQDMKKYSRRYPDTVFQLRGDGEESLDIWAKWFKNGEMQTWRLELNIPDIDHPPSPWPSAKPGSSSAG